MSIEVALTAAANAQATQHLLSHHRNGLFQEDLCFGLWRPSTGSSRTTALISEIILPEDSERTLHENVSFQPEYLARAIDIAREAGAGLAFMHSHLSDGWQDMSNADRIAERDIIAYPALATDLPLIGMTVGTDGYWSARSWNLAAGQMILNRCVKVRIADTNAYRLHFDDTVLSPPGRRPALRRTVDTWGVETQNKLARMRIGVVGIGSVGSIVAEAIARMGVADITLIDPDTIEEHNLDRLINASYADVGRRKVDVAEHHVRRHATADPRRLAVVALAAPIQNEAAYRAALDCDVLFSCVDNAIARDVLNFIAISHLIPVIDGGIMAEMLHERFFTAHWQAHVVTPETRCLRCIGQYDTSRVAMERQGLLDTPSYIETLPESQRPRNQNVFPFSLGLAGMEVNLMLHYCLLADRPPDGWPSLQAQDYRFVLGDIVATTGVCRDQCEFRQRVALGDRIEPLDLIGEDTSPTVIPKQQDRQIGEIEAPQSDAVHTHSDSLLSRIARFLRLR